MTYIIKNKSFTILLGCQTSFFLRSFIDRTFLFQGKVYKDRKAKGEYPYMPEVEDRARIKEQYFKAVKDSF